MSPKRLSVRLRALWNRRRKESDLEDEIAFHLSEETDERRAGGLSADEARAAARRDFGNVLRVREATRDTWGWASGERLSQDVRSAVRVIRRDRRVCRGHGSSRSRSASVPTTAMLNVVHALVIRSLPLRPPIGSSCCTPRRLAGMFATPRRFMIFGLEAPEPRLCRCSGVPAGRLRRHR